MKVLDPKEHYYVPCPWTTLKGNGFWGSGKGLSYGICGVDSSSLMSSLSLLSVSAGTLAFILCLLKWISCFVLLIFHICSHEWIGTDRALFVQNSFWSSINVFTEASGTSHIHC